MVRLFYFLSPVHIGIIMNICFPVMPYGLYIHIYSVISYIFFSNLQPSSTSYPWRRKYQNKEAIFSMVVLDEPHALVSRM